MAMPPRRVMKCTSPGEHRIGCIHFHGITGGKRAQIEGYTAGSDLELDVIGRLVYEGELSIIVSSDEFTASHLQFKITVTADIKRISNG